MAAYKNAGRMSDEEIVDSLLQATFPEIQEDVTLSDVGTTLSAHDANRLLKTLSNYAIADEIYKQGYTYPGDSDKLKTLFLRAHENAEYAIPDAKIPSGARNSMNEAKQYIEHGFASGSKYSIGSAHTPYNYAYYNEGMKEACGLMYMSDYIDRGNGYMKGAMLEFAEVARELPEDLGIPDGKLTSLTNKMYGGFGTEDFYNKNSTSVKIFRYLYGEIVKANEPDASEESGDNHDEKSWWIQSGADPDDGLTIRFGKMDTDYLGISGLDVSTQTGALDAMARVKDGLQVLSSIRSDIGAQQNRLEHTIANENNIIENTTSAESQIRDADMEKESVQFSMKKILEQAGISMMSQANQSNQGTLQLLQ